MVKHFLQLHMRSKAKSKSCFLEACLAIVQAGQQQKDQPAAQAKKSPASGAQSAKVTGSSAAAPKAEVHALRQLKRLQVMSILTIFVAMRMLCRCIRLCHEEARHSLFL